MRARLRTWGSHSNLRSSARRGRQRVTQVRGPTATALPASNAFNCYRDKQRDNTVIAIGVQSDAFDALFLRKV